MFGAGTVSDRMYKNRGCITQYSIVQYNTVPSYYHLASSIQNFLTGKKFKNDKDIMSKGEAFFKDLMYKLPSRCQDIICNNGSYIIQ